MSDLIRREDVFKALGITDKSTKYGGDHSGYNTLMLYEIKGAIDSIPNAETTGALDDSIQEYIKDGYILAEPKWIPCEERLPDETEAVYLICTEGGYMCSCRWTNVKPLWTDLTMEWHWSPFDKPQYSKVVAWMPLKPYEMEGSE